MKASDCVRGLRKLSQVLQRSPDPGTEEAFWDKYARNVRATGTRSYPYVGCDWHNEEDFISLLQQYAVLGARALEIGCGGGRITAAAAKLFAHVHAGDVSGEMLRECEAAITAPNVSFHKLDGFTLQEFADGSMDNVYAHDVFVQLSSIQVYPYLREIRRVLAPGGIGLVSCYDFVAQFEKFREISLRFWQARWPGSPRRLHFLTQEMLLAMLADVGVEVLQVHRGTFLTVAFRKPR